MIRFVAQIAVSNDSESDMLEVFSNPPEWFIWSNGNSIFCFIKYTLVRIYRAFV